MTAICQILRLKCTKIQCRVGLCHRPHWGAYSAPPDHLAGFKGSYFGEDGTGRERRRWDARQGIGGEGDERRGQEGKEREERKGKRGGVVQSNKILKIDPAGKRLKI